MAPRIPPIESSDSTFAALSRSIMQSESFRETRPCGPMVPSHSSGSSLDKKSLQNRSESLKKHSKTSKSSRPSSVLNGSFAKRVSYKEVMEGLLEQPETVISEQPSTELLSLLPSQKSSFSAFSKDSLIRDQPKESSKLQPSSESISKLSKKSNNRSINESMHQPSNPYYGTNIVPFVDQDFETFKNRSKTKSYQESKEKDLGLAKRGKSRSSSKTASKTKKHDEQSEKLGNKLGPIKEMSEHSGKEELIPEKLMNENGNFATKLEVVEIPLPEQKRFNPRAYTKRPPEQKLNRCCRCFNYYCCNPRPKICYCPLLQPANVNQKYAKRANVRYSYNKYEEICGKILTIILRNSVSPAILEDMYPNLSSLIRRLCKRLMKVHEEKETMSGNFYNGYNMGWRIAKNSVEPNNFHICGCMRKKRSNGREFNLMSYYNKLCGRSNSKGSYRTCINCAKSYYYRPIMRHRGQFKSICNNYPQLRKKYLNIYSKSGGNYQDMNVMPTHSLYSIGSKVAPALWSTDHLVQKRNTFSQ